MSLNLLTTAGCLAGDNDPPASEKERATLLQYELENLIEEGHDAELPPPMQPERLMLLELKLHRRQVAEGMVTQARSAMVPLALAASMLAPEGAVDLLLSITPVHKLDKAAELGREALQVRRGNKQSRKLLKLYKDFERLLPEDATEFLQLAQKLSRAERRALKTIHRHTHSVNLVQTLMDKHLRGHADVRWIAGKLQREPVDAAFARRFTFDADMVEEYTNHDANPSWKVLESVVERRSVTKEERASLAVKVKGLMGERAAADIVRSPAFSSRHLKQSRQEPPALARGMRYRRASSAGKPGSIDIVVFGQSTSEALFIEVKNMNRDSWNRGAERTRVLEQLARHNEGIEDILARGYERRTVAGRVLMVADDGYKNGIAAKLEREAFETAAGELGWTVEFIPANDIASFDMLIDALKN